MKYDVDYFIKKFEAIPEDKWITGDLGFHGTHCALGHCGVNQNNLSQLIYHNTKLQNTEGAELSNFFDNFFGTYTRMYNNVARVNDGKMPGYYQSSPKQRILAALYDIKAKQHPEVKERTVYVVVSPEIKEQVKELIYN